MIHAKPSRLKGEAVNSIKRWFVLVGDFGQRAQGVLWLIGIGLAVVVAIFGIQTSQMPAEQKALLYFSVIIVLALSSLATTVYILYLRDKLHERNQQLKDVTEESALLILEAESAREIEQSSQGVDEVILQAMHNKDDGDKEKRDDCILIIMIACQQNILPGIDQNERRVAFLEYPRTGDAFTLVEGCGLAHESRLDVKRNLTKTTGAAAFAIATKFPVIINDIRNSEDAQRKGYKPSSSQERFRSLLCVGVWLNDEPIGVISADCMEPNAFSDSDIKVLQRFARKIRIAYTLFPT